MSKSNVSTITQTNTNTADEPQLVKQLPARPAADANYSFNGVYRRDVAKLNHGLHKYPAKFIPHIPRWAIQFRNLQPGSLVLDPFCGSGTTLVEAGISGYSAHGVDISPLAVLISRAKTSRVALGSDPAKTASKICERAHDLQPRFEQQLQQNEGQEVCGLHWTWSNWFRPKELSGLLALRDSITSECARKTADRHLALGTVSAITKRCSFLSEDQIKVRFDHNKEPQSPFKLFADRFTTAYDQQRELTRIFRDKGVSLSAKQGSADSTGLDDGEVDRIVTSPPYMNAVDYTMNQKYNLFVLGLLEPGAFKEHCREYIGVTERAVRKRDYDSVPSGPTASVDELTKQLRSIGTTVALNRSFVAWNYFHGMWSAFREFRRVLRRRGLAIVLVGETNRICGLTVPTSDLLIELAKDAGLKLSLRFYHVLANRSSMRMNRASTGGSIQREAVLVFQR